MILQCFNRHKQRFFWRIHTGFFFFFFLHCEFFEGFLRGNMAQIRQILRGEKTEIATFRQQVPAFCQYNMARILILANVFQYPKFG